jgi:hypothetical protein
MDAAVELCVAVSKANLGAGKNDDGAKIEADETGSAQEELIECLCTQTESHFLIRPLT